MARPRTPGAKENYMSCGELTAQGSQNLKSATNKEFVRNRERGAMQGSNSYKTHQNQTFRPKPLSIEQLHAVELLITGTTDAEVAATIGVDRSTVWTWRNRVPQFGDCLATGQKTTFASSLKRLFTLWRLAGRLPSAPMPDVMAVRCDHSEHKRLSVQTAPPDHFIRLRDIFVPRAAGAEPGAAGPAQATRRG